MTTSPFDPVIDQEIVNLACLVDDLANRLVESDPGRGRELAGMMRLASARFDTIAETNGTPRYA